MMDTRRTFSKGIGTTTYPAECGRIRTHQHYISWYAPSMVKQEGKGMHKLKIIMKDTKTVTIIYRAIRYSIMCVMHDTIQFKRKFSPTDSPLEILVIKVWEE